ncbi:two-component system response regulator [Sulfitobacter aestuarii]|uniref:Two-component system response regulator n=1 Tax=Sulfitobacter aestuarii TaxID=2161676 RepID=A0ABW5U3W4_9RHOB
MRILAVDDDPVILDLLTGCLTEHDQYDLVCCDSAEAAFEKIEGALSPFDCLLLDIMLPGVDGIEMCEVLRARKSYRTTPIIMITASKEPDLMLRAFDAGATDFICKPLDGVELGARINSAGMLNASLLRERNAQHTLAELSEMAKIRFDEGFALDVEEVSDFLSLENYLLRLPAGCFSMSLFSIEVEGARGIYRSVKAAAFRDNLEQVARAAIDGLTESNFRLAYAGSGRFVGVVLGRQRLDLQRLAERIDSHLMLHWNPRSSRIMMPPVLRVRAVSEQRLWSGLAASDRLRDHLAHFDPLHGLARDSEDDLFARLETVIERKA